MSEVAASHTPECDQVMIHDERTIAIYQRNTRRLSHEGVDEGILIYI